MSAVASANGEEVDVDGAVSLYFDAEEVDDELVGDDGFAPNGKQRLRLAGRWFNDSQSSERFKVTHAIFENYFIYEILKSDIN